MRCYSSPLFYHQLSLPFEQTFILGLVECHNARKMSFNEKRLEKDAYKSWLQKDDEFRQSVLFCLQEEHRPKCNGKVSLQEE